jgi:DNA-binding CsgD family transcriptional regulator/PAS domain-containing protein
MVSVEDFSRLVSGIYAAAVAPHHWELAIRDIHKTLGGTAGALLTAEGPVWSIERSILPTGAAESYADYYCQIDHVLAAVQAGTVAAIRTGTELIYPYRTTEFYADWMHPYQLDDALLVKLNDGPRPACFIVASRLCTESFDTLERLNVIGGLIPHIQQAVHIRDRFAALVDKTAELAGALESVRHGIAIVNCDHALVTVNSAAERILRNEDGLAVRAGRLTAGNPRGARELSSAIGGAITGDSGGTTGARSLSCRRPSGKRPYVVHVLPFEPEDTPHHAVALVLMIDPDDEPQPPVALLRSLYHLTQTEAEVALHVMHGVDLKQISEHLSISLTTVRTHLQHVFDKTDTHRQAELVHLLHLIDP